ncbi:MAG: hypothetical protein ACYTHJ_14765 [Planctomycetota bacterium]|jgi:hypothetical protein
MRNKNLPGSIMVLLAGAASSGCGLTGTWHTISVQPEDETFPLTHVTFTSDGRYTATMEFDGERRTSTGAYRWSLGKLTIDPERGEQRVYKGRQLFNGDLLLTHRSAGPPERTIQGVLSRKKTPQEP